MIRVCLSPPIYWCPRTEGNEPKAYVMLKSLVHCFPYTSISNNGFGSCVSLYTRCWLSNMSKICTCALYGLLSVTWNLSFPLSTWSCIENVNFWIWLTCVNIVAMENSFFFFIQPHFYLILLLLLLLQSLLLMTISHLLSGVTDLGKKNTESQVSAVVVKKETIFTILTNIV